MKKGMDRAMKDRGMLLGELETELSESTIGYVTAVTVVPGGWRW